MLIRSGQEPKPVTLDRPDAVAPHRAHLAQGLDLHFGSIDNRHHLIARATQR
jgi:hypothetical protein